MITNAYVIYLHVNIENVIKKDLLSHHDFRESVALAWINPREQYEKIPAPVSTIKSKAFSASSLSSISVCSNTCGVSNKTGLRISDVLLGTRGAMSIRLEAQYDQLPHSPQIKNQDLHYIGGVVLI